MELRSSRTELVARHGSPSLGWEHCVLERSVPVMATTGPRTSYHSMGPGVVSTCLKKGRYGPPSIAYTHISKELTSLP